MKRLQAYWEKQIFGVCDRLGEKFGLSSSSIRMYFIYLSFLAYGSPIIIYLALAFIMNIRQHIRKKRSLYYEF